jgi:CRISPR type I-E-associated protein CasB/Cse2
MTTSAAAATPAARPQDPWLPELARAFSLIFERPEAAARCRGGLGKAPMEVPGMWEYCAPVIMTVGEDNWQRRDLELATHHVLTLYALHQQSRAERMHRQRTPGDSRSVGAASRRLYSERSSEGVKRRFLATATASSVPELAGHLRHLVTLLRGEGIPLDYTALFRDITAWQDPVRRAKVRRHWGLDFHRIPTSTAQGSTSDNDDREQAP